MTRIGLIYFISTFILFSQSLPPIMENRISFLLSANVTTIKPNTTKLPNEKIVNELCDHFSVNPQYVSKLSQLLLRMKELAHKKEYGDRVFSFDSEVDNKKEVSISEIQPTTKPELAPFLFEGDIFLSDNQATDILTRLEQNRTSRSLSSDPEAIWHQQPIKFRFHDSLEFFAISQIVEAIEFWENNTCVVFKHAQDVGKDGKDEEDYIEFFKGQGCYSMIGRYGGRQGVSIGSGCERVGIIEHEIGHVLGLWHEQSRPDAGRFVEVRKQFILPSYMSDFQKRGTDEIITLGVPYDYGSAMHYGPTAFSADGNSLTLITKNHLYQSTIGQRERLSFYDIQIINKAYCPDKCGINGGHGNSIYCYNGGYPHPNHCHRCICPSGYGGADCSSFEQPLNADCGGLVNVEFDQWKEIKSPGYDEDGYSENQQCNWIIRTVDSYASSDQKPEKRIEVEFVGDFSFLCSSTCLDYALNKATDPFIVASAKHVSMGMAILKPNNLPNQWSSWGAWSECSRPCGGCGIRSRIRVCLSEECEDKAQEFGACNFDACPVKSNCADNKLLFLNRLCRRDASASMICSHISESLVDCNKPRCCPPFYPDNGKCITRQFDPLAPIGHVQALSIII
ncbi:astacin (Peptidase family m12A) domain-containing protein [Ditylenchus destructor]|uniref:Zinc metalloproteinase n=1 Tax=Ditylenchus destructor TaxID=166010 RepID=A0AAD4MR27_9BILA|nr:astacin (Peptidase family m12A) domain-containing protein [Ditylenchus destructor]